VLASGLPCHRSRKRDCWRATLTHRHQWLGLNRQLRAAASRVLPSNRKLTLRARAPFRPLMEGPARGVECGVRRSSVGAPPLQLLVKTCTGYSGQPSQPAQNHAFKAGQAVRASSGRGRPLRPGPAVNVEPQFDLASLNAAESRSRSAGSKQQSSGKPAGRGSRKRPFTERGNLDSHSAPRRQQPAGERCQIVRSSGGSLSGANWVVARAAGRRL
jgi:hypothetical protein